MQYLKVESLAKGISSGAKRTVNSVLSFAAILPSRGLISKGQGGSLGAAATLFRDATREELREGLAASARFTMFQSKSKHTAPVFWTVNLNTRAWNINVGRNVIAVVSHEN